MSEGPVADFVNQFPDGDGSANLQPNPETSQVNEGQQSQIQDSTPSLLDEAKIDLTGLPEEQQVFLRQREREMQAQMTRRLQESTDARREAEQSLAFINALNSDPNFAFQVLNQIQGNLAAAGYEFDSAESWEDQDEYGLGDQGPDPYVQQELAALRAQNEQIEQYFVEQQLASQLDAQLSQIKASHPEYGDAEMQAIIDMGYATGGNLIAAADQFAAVNDAVISRYLSNKASVNTPSPLPNTSGVTQTSTGVEPKTDEELRAAAMERLRNAFS